MDDEESNGAGAAKHAAGAGAGAGAGPGPIPIGAPRRQADDDWKNFAKRDVKPLR